jgi:hypothetical protein
MRNGLIPRLTTLLLAMALVLIISGPAPAEKAPGKTLEKIEAVGGKDEFPNANYIVIESLSETEYQLDGRLVSTTYELNKILTAKGKNSLGEEHIPYFKAYDSVIVNFARVIKSDGEIIEVPEDHIKDVSSAMAEMMNIYMPDAREKVISFKGLQVGDCIEYKYTEDVFHAYMDSAFDGVDIFQYTEPLLYRKNIITGPEEMPLNFAVKNGEVNFEKEKHDGKITYTWWAENQPAIVTEPAMPSLLEIAPTLYCSTLESWKEISRWWCEIAEEKMVVNDSMRLVIDSLTAGKSKDEAIASVYHYVAQKVRYMGLGTGKKQGLEPKPAVETFETKYGVCRDVATLMTAMLREANIEADIVLTMMGSKVEKEIPGIRFNHAIVAIKDDQGGYYFSDPTIENLPTLFPSLEQEQNILICTKEGRDLEITPHQSAEENLGQISANSRLTPEGSFVSDVVITSNAFYDMILRSITKSMPEKQVNMMLGQILQSVYPGAKLSYLEISDPEDLDMPMTMKFGYKINDYALEAGDYLLVKMPISTGVFEIVSMFVLESAKLPERQHPWNLGFTYGAVEDEVLTLPEGYELKAYPADQLEKYDHSLYETAYSSYSIPEPQSGQLSLKFQKKFLVDKKQMSPEEYGQFLKVLQAKDKSSRGEIILEKKDI